MQKIILQYNKVIINKEAFGDIKGIVNKITIMKK